MTPGMPKGTAGTPKGTARAARSERRRATVAGIALSSPDRILWPDAGITKFDLARFQAFVAHRVLPYLTGRPISLLRCPKGCAQPCFVQRHPHGTMTAVRRIVMRGSTDGGALLSVDDVAGLISLVQIGVIELHPWPVRAESPRTPDRLMFDLDPGPGVAWPTIAAAACDLRDRLREKGLESFVKTTGGKGLHLVVPLDTRTEPRAGWTEVRTFARRMAEAMAGDSPNRYTADAAIEARPGRIYIDCLRNAYGASAVAPYSPRARPGAPVSVPLFWEELEMAATPILWTVADLHRRLDGLARDPWADLHVVRQRLNR